MKDFDLGDDIDIEVDAEGNATLVTWTVKKPDGFYAMVSSKSSDSNQCELWLKAGPYTAMEHAEKALDDFEPDLRKTNPGLKFTIERAKNVAFLPFPTIVGPLN